jgi:hypothetical protein
MTLFEINPYDTNNLKPSQATNEPTNYNVTINKSSKPFPIIDKKFNYTKFLNSTNYSSDEINKVLSKAKDIVNSANNINVSAKKFVIKYKNLRLLVVFNYDTKILTLINHIVDGSLKSYPTINIKSMLEELFTDDSKFLLPPYKIVDNEHARLRVSERSLTKYASKHDIEHMCISLVGKITEIKKLGISFTYAVCYSPKTKQSICFQLYERSIIISTYLDVDSNTPKDGNLYFKVDVGV